MMFSWWQGIFADLEKCYLLEENTDGAISRPYINPIIFF
jgi:hypothetical protein